MSLIYSMLMSVDGYVEDEHGRFDWAAPDEEVHSYINQLESSVGTYLYGRRMYETMIYWETAHSVPDQPQFVLDWARQWQATEKIVYSRTLAEPRSRRTRIEREFDPDVVRRLKGGARHDITVNGPALAAHALRAGLVDEIQMFICPAVVGAGKRFFPDCVRLKLELATSTGSATAWSFCGTLSVADRSEGGSYEPLVAISFKLLRIIAAFVNTVHGTQKLFGFPAPFPMPHLPPLFLAGGIIETFGGLLLLLGLFTRPVAFILSGEMAVAYFKFHAPQGFWPLLNDGEGVVLYCFMFLYFASTGGGPWSFDRLLRKRASTV